MHSYPQLKLLIEEEIQKIIYPANPKKLYEPIDYVLNLGGKRIRPILLLMSYQLFKSNIDKAISSALAIEIFHNFTLLHDDVMDNAPLRRGKKTTHEKWDKNVAVLSGDTMMIQAYHLISLVDSDIIQDVLAVFNKAATQVCEGQQLDMDFEKKMDVSIQDYLRMIELKTSVLLASSLKIGAIIGRSSSEDAENLYKFGRNLGMAFQLQDDYLDVFGDPDTFGKKVGGDILANKKTFLYLQALSLCDQKTKEKLINYFSVTDICEDEKVESVKQVYVDLNVPEISKNLMMKYYKTAFFHLDKVISDNKDPLYSFSKLLLEREN